MKRGDALFARACGLMPGGVNSDMRGVSAGWSPRPPVLRSGTGSRLIDEDGEEWLDCLLGLGAVFPGHREPSVLDAVERQIRESGALLGLPIARESDAAQRIVDAVPSIDMVRFCNTGTEAVLYAVRLAKGWTGRAKILKFDGMYHGFADSVSFGPNLISIPWNDVAALRRTLDEDGDAIAAVITEPVMCNEGCVLPQDGYLKTLSTLVRAAGAVLIFDEVITGFRSGLSGAQGRFGIDPDLTVLGKAIGGGYPVACVGGRSGIMQLVTDGVVPMLGTYAGNGIAIAAVDACIELYARRGAEVQQLFARADALAERLRTPLATMPFKSSVTSFGPVLQFSFGTEEQRRSKELFARFWRGMMEQHVLIHPSQDEVIFFSLAHDDDDLARFELACTIAVGKL